jgi:protein-tyrosine-phosphatase
MDEALRSALGSARGLLFLCSGNIVRSAFAEVWARHRGCPLPVASAATTYRNVGGLHAPAARLLASRGVPLDAIESFTSRHLELALPSVDRGTVVLGMTREHLELGARLAPDLPSFPLGLALGDASDIEDPMYDGRFAERLERVARCVDALVEELGRLSLGRRPERPDYPSRGKRAGEDSG